MHDFYQEYVSSGQAGVVQRGRDPGRGDGRPFLLWIERRTALPGRHARIIDAACGPGRLVSVLRSLGYDNVAGVDVSREQVDAGDAGGVAGLVCSDATGFLEHEPPGSVDAVFALDFLEHLELADALRFLHAVRRSLRADGRLVLHVPNADSPFFGAVRYADVTHTRAFTRRSLEQLLYPAGLRVEWVEEGKPVVHGLASFARRVIWSVGRAAMALLWAAETGWFPAALSRNITVLARPRAD